MATYDQLTIEGSPRGFAINGEQLGALVDLGGKRCIYDLDPKTKRAYVAALLLRAPSPLAPGICPLYVCPLCADLDCGAVSVRVTEVDDCFVWSELSLGALLPWRDPRLERSFYFARADYLAAIY